MANSKHSSGSALDPILKNYSLIIKICAALLFLTFFFVPVYSFAGFVPNAVRETLQTTLWNQTWPTMSFLNPTTPFMLIFYDGFGVWFVLLGVLPLLLLLFAFLGKIKGIAVICIVAIAAYAILRPLVHGSYTFTTHPTFMVYDGSPALGISSFHWAILAVYAILLILTGLIMFNKVKDAPKV